MCVFTTRFGGYVITTRQELAAQRGGGAHQFALAAAELAANTRCVNVVLLYLRGRSPVTEYFVIATGTSPRQMRTVVDEISDLGAQTGFAPWHSSGYESAKWIVLDCVNVVVHVFDVESRDFYDLELLWGDSPRIDWRQELGLPPAPLIPPRAPEVEEQDDLEDDADVMEDDAAINGEANAEAEPEAVVPADTELSPESTAAAAEVAPVMNAPASADAAPPPRSAKKKVVRKRQPLTKKPAPKPTKKPTKKAPKKTTPKKTPKKAAKKVTKKAAPKKKPARG